MQESSNDVRLNVLGIPVDEFQVDNILDMETNSFEWHRRVLTYFFHLENPSKLSRDVLIRYAEACARMVPIMIGSDQRDIHNRLINTLASAKRCYANAEYIGCIELCALHGEMLANYLCITNRKELESIEDKLSEEDQNKIIHCKDIYFSDSLGQTLRLRWLEKAKIIEEEDSKGFKKVHGLRIRYFHHWSNKGYDEKNDALKALSVISPVTKKYLEIYDNETNLMRVKKYMKIVSADLSIHDNPNFQVESAGNFICRFWNSILNLVR